MISCEEYHPEENALKPSQIHLTSAKSGFGAVIIQGNSLESWPDPDALSDFVYLCGGNDGTTILKTFECMNTQSRLWKALPCLQYRRDELALAVGTYNCIYAIGGFGGPDK